MNTRDINFNVRFDKEGRRELELLSTIWRCSRAEALRRCVSNAAGHLSGTMPCCADGGRCFVPHMHTKQNAE